MPIWERYCCPSLNHILLSSMAMCVRKTVRNWPFAPLKSLEGEKQSASVFYLQHDSQFQSWALKQDLEKEKRTSNPSTRLFTSSIIRPLCWVWSSVNIAERYCDLATTQRCWGKSHQVKIKSILSSGAQRRNCNFYCSRYRSKTSDRSP